MSTDILVKGKCAVDAGNLSFVCIREFLKHYPINDPDDLKVFHNLTTMALFARIPSGTWQVAVTTETYLGRQCDNFTITFEEETPIYIGDLCYLRDDTADAPRAIIESEWEKVLSHSDILRKPLPGARIYQTGGDGFFDVIASFTEVKG